MTEKEIKTILDKYLTGDCTADETAFVEGWYNEYARKQSADVTHSELEEKRLQIKDSFPAPISKRIFPLYIKYAAAAVLAIASLTGGVYYYITSTNTLTKNYTANIIQPGGNDAVLTLANGKKINLKDTRSHSMATDEAVITIDRSKGIVIYKTISSKTDRGINHNNTDQKDHNTINTISTPRGGQFKLILPDGSSVLLNASSSLQFPIRFAAHLRKVTLVGEAYFEVTKNDKQPFVVTTKGQELTVLGTHFNVAAYPNETIKTTLSQGSVQLTNLTNSSSLKKQILQPEQQAVLTSNGFELTQVNSTDEMAWKDGMFIYKQASIQEVLRQLCRWYNVDADLDNLPNARLDVEVSRKSALEDVIKIINYVNRDVVQIQLIKNERRLIIKKK